MILQNNNRGIRSVLGVVAAVGMLACLATAAMAQQGRRDNDRTHQGDTQQNHNWNNGNANGHSDRDHRDRSWHSDGHRNTDNNRRSHSWNTDNDGRRYHQRRDNDDNQGQGWSNRRRQHFTNRPGTRYHGSERRKYYTHDGHDYYLNLDTGNRVRL